MLPQCKQNYIFYSLPRSLCTGYAAFCVYFAPMDWDRQQGPMPSCQPSGIMWAWATREWAVTLDFRLPSHSLHSSETHLMRTVKSTIALVLGVTVLTLSACGAGGQSRSVPSGSTASTLPPKYLEVDQFRQCLALKQVGAHQQWCMPASRPDSCPAQSWDRLNGLQGGDRVPNC